MTDLPKWNEPHGPLRESEMSVIGQLFAIRFVAENQVELYVEDDEFYFLKARFSRDWLEDLCDVAYIASRRLPDSVGPAQRPQETTAGSDRG